MINKHGNTKGFTIVELLVVIVVVGILAAITITSYSGVQQRATISSLQSDLNNASKLLKLDQIDIGSFPVTISAANGGKGVSFSTGTTLDYVVNNPVKPSSFCMTATKNNITYKITDNSSPVTGDCQDFGLVSRWDAGNTNSYPGSGATWVDLNSTNNGTLVNGVGFDAVQGGGSLLFDGINDNVDFGNNIEWSGAMSAVSWHKRTAKDTVSADGIFGNWYWASALDSRRGWVHRYYINTDVLQFVIELTNGINNQELQTNYTTAVNNWYYVVSVFDPSNRTVKLYVNGVLQSTNTASAGYDAIAYDSIYPVRAGYNPVNSGYFTGYISEAKVYNRVLSANEIQTYFNNSKSRYGL